jgi:hypothetical protein
MCELIRLLEQCQADTQEVLGPGAAGRLAHWQQYTNDRERLIRFIKKRIRGTWRNGAELHRRGRLSLEQIVIQCGSEVFDDSDIERANATLSLALADRPKL